LFQLSDPSNRITADDGAYVEVIHTNYHMLGFREPLGDADFYPNFGRVMPGCEDDVTGQCSHSRSTMYYAESITDTFTATECVSFEEIAEGRCTPTGRTSILGGPVAKIGLTGNYVLFTNAEAPFSQG
jgi:pancreatic triacylglycerol lipase